jgi:hypothetical protein
VPAVEFGQAEVAVESAALGGGFEAAEECEPEPPVEQAVVGHVAVLTESVVTGGVAGAFLPVRDQLADEGVCRGLRIGRVGKQIDPVVVTRL